MNNFQKEITGVTIGQMKRKNVGGKEETKDVCGSLQQYFEYLSLTLPMYLTHQLCSTGKLWIISFYTYKKKKKENV